MRLKQRSKVLLPQPEGPMMAVTRRSRISIETSCSAWNFPYQKLRLATRARTAAVCSGASTKFKLLRDWSFTTASLGPEVPAKPIPDEYGDSIHRQRHPEKEDAGGRGVDVKGLLGPRDPVEHLDLHDGERRI